MVFDTYLSLSSSGLGFLTWGDLDWLTFTVFGFGDALFLKLDVFFLS